MDQVAPERRHLPAPGLVVAVAILVAGLLVGIAHGVSDSRRHRSHKGALNAIARSSEADLAYDVPWAALPAPPEEPLPLVSEPPLPRGATACSAADVYVDPSSIMSDQITQDDGIVVGFRNVSSARCLLAGPPSAELTGGGMTSYRLPPTGQMPFDGVVTADMSPGQTTQVEITSPRACADNGYGSGTAPRYDHLVFAMPGEGDVVVPARLHSACGTRITDYYVEPPQPPAAADPWAAVTATMTLPTSTSAGSSMTYVITLTNASDRDLDLVDLCPGYVETAEADAPMKEVYGLNCAAAKTLPAHRELRFEMELAVPAVGSGIMSVYWTLLTVSGGGHATGTVLIAN